MAERRCPAAQETEIRKVEKRDLLRASHTLGLCSSKSEALPNTYRIRERTPSPPNYLLLLPTNASNQGIVPSQGPSLGKVIINAYRTIKVSHCVALVVRSLERMDGRLGGSVR